MNPNRRLNLVAAPVKGGSKLSVRGVPPGNERDDGWAPPGQQHRSMVLWPRLGHRLANAGFALLLALFGLRSAGAATDLPLLAPCFGHHMVLRQPPRNERRNVILWGWVQERQYVSVQFPGTKLIEPDYKRDAGLPDRKPGYRFWLLTGDSLPGPMPTNGPFSLTLRKHRSPPGDKIKKPEEVLETHEVTNVMVGAVWVMRVRPDRGAAHEVKTEELSPHFRVLHGSDLVWGPPSSGILGWLNSNGWVVPARNASALENLPGLVAYTGRNWSTSGPPPSAALGIIWVDNYPGEPMKDRARMVTGENPMKKTLGAAFGDCRRDEAGNEPKRLRAKRRGEPTSSLGLRPPTANVDQMLPQADDTFFYYVDGFFW